MTFEEIAKTVRSISFGMPLSVWSPSVAVSYNMDGVLLNDPQKKIVCVTRFRKVPERNGNGNTTVDLYSKSFPQELSKFKTKADVFRWVKCELMRQLEHELEESLFYRKKRMMDPHRTNVEAQIKRATKKSQSCI